MRVIAGLAALLVAGAQEMPQGKKREPRNRVEISGTIVCVGCTLEKDQGADSQCSLHAKHAQGLLAQDGTLWHLLDNARGHDLVTREKYRGREVKMLAWKYPSARHLEVWNFKIEKGGQWFSYAYCRNCGWEPGDFKDRDFCGGCDQGK